MQRQPIRWCETYSGMPDTAVRDSIPHWESKLALNFGVIQNYCGGDRELIFYDTASVGNFCDPEAPPAM